MVLSSVNRTSASLLQHKSNVSSNSDEMKCHDVVDHCCHKNYKDENSWTLSEKLRGMTIGAVKGFVEGISADLMFGIIPTSIGFVLGGPAGAAIGAAILPAFGVTYNAINGCVHPVKYQNLQFVNPMSPAEQYQAANNDGF